jgi:threonine/homoserine/homoserine lactone efflux protein
MQYVAFLGILLLGAMSPGPDFVVVTRHAVFSGRSVGVACALGIGVGVFGWTLAVALGVAGVLAASAEVFAVIKLLGAAYLVYLGARALIAARRGAYQQLGERSEGTVGMAAGMRDGLLTNLFNPKVAVFYLALLPQFLPTGATAWQTVLLATAAAAVTASWFALLAVVIGALRRFLTSIRVRRIMDAVFGALLVALGVRIAALA